LPSEVFSASVRTKIFFTPEGAFDSTAK